MKEEVEKLIELGEKIIEKKDSLGVDDIEVYIAKVDKYMARVITSYVTTQHGLDAGVGIRVNIGKKVGFASISSLDLDKILETAKIAVKIAKTKKEDPNFTHLPDPVGGFKHTSIFDEKLYGLSSSQLSEMLSNLVKKTKDTVKSYKKVDIFLIRYNYAFAVVNSRDVAAGDYGSAIASWYEITLEENGKPSNGVESYLSRRLEEDKLYGVVDKAYEMAREGLKAKKISEPFEGTAVITPDVLESIIWPLTYNVSALNVQEGRSRFIGQIGKVVANEKLTIYDDGTLPEGMNTNAVDDEGIPMKKKILLEKGKLMTYLYDTYTAYKEGKNSTGNARRNDYKSQPSPGVTNLVFENTVNKDLEELISSVDKGVVLRGYAMGAHMINPIKGSMAITCLNALYVEDGEVKYPLSAVAMSDDYFEFLKKIIAVGSDYKITSIGKLPTILVEKVHFS